MMRQCVKCSGDVPHGRKVCDACKPKCLVCGETVFARGLTNLCATCRESWQWCAVCEKVKPLGDFRFPNGGKTRWCYVCTLEKSRKRGETTESKEYHYRYHLRRKFGIDDARVDELLAITHCEVCGEPPKAGRRLNIDHDHKTNTIRGAVCSRCNHFLAALDADHLLEDLRRYLGAELMTRNTAVPPTTPDERAAGVRAATSRVRNDDALYDRGDEHPYDYTGVEFSGRGDSMG